MLWYFSDLKVILLIMHGCIGMTNDETIIKKWMKTYK